MTRANASRIAAAAIEAGDLTLLREAAFDAVADGRTTIAEAMRATKG
jgi:type II secretory ATPase GspE/PulE/Tfp pilus assembly ATPase PilB-like protein